MKGEKYYDEYEIDLKEYIKVLWDEKWVIIGLFIIAVLIAGIYSQFFIEPQYEAKSTLLILPSKYKTSLEVSTLPIETYRNLALTDSMRASIIEELDLQNSDGEPYTISDLAGMMSLEIQGITGNSRANDSSNQAPLMVLKIKGSDPEILSKIANVWANNFMEASKEIRKGEFKEVSLVIENQFKDTKEKLYQAKEKLKDFNKETRLKLTRYELSIKEERLKDYMDRLVDLRTQLGFEKARYNHLEKILVLQEKGGNWVGELDKHLSVEESIFAVEARHNYIDGQDKLLIFLRDHDIELLKERITLEKSELKKYQLKINSLRDTLKENRVEVEKLEELLAKEPDRWDLKRAVTDDILWEKILNPEEIKVIKDMKLTDEIINPIYQKLKDRISDSQILIECIPEQIEYYNDLIVEKTSELEELNYKLKEWEQTISRLKTDIAHYEGIYETEASSYQELKAGLLESRVKLDSLEKQVTFYKETTESLSSAIKDLQDQIWEGEITQQQLAKQVEDIQTTYNMLATKVEEARISEAQKTSDVKFIAEAIPPTKSIGNNKKLNVAIAGVLALMLGIFIVFFREFMREEEVQENKSF